MTHKIRQPLTLQITDTYFSRATLEDHKRQYQREQERRWAEEQQRLAEARRLRRLRHVEEVKSRLLHGEPTPAAAAIPDELEVSDDVLPYAPKRKAVDFDLLERLLPGYRATDSKDFRRPAEAPIYEPLPGPDWFRLLVLEPWRADKKRLRCHLRAVRLDDAAGKYSALSYCWTQPVRRAVQSLLCNGHPVDAGDNLRLALYNNQYVTLPRIVWADALCINQDDPAERSQQVQLMGKIYQQATETIVWLGDVFRPGPTVPEFEAICKVVKSWDKSLTPSYESRNARGRLRRYEPSLPETSRWSSQRPFDPKYVAELFRCPWFSRRWVIQEVALARSAVVQIPGATVPWKWIGLAAGIIRTNHNHLITTHRMPNLYNAYLITRLSPHGPLPPLPLSLLPLLRLTANFLTTDPLDTVYALLAFHPGALKADYALTPTALSLQVASYSLSQPHRPLSFLSDAAGLSSTPTWAPCFGPNKPSMLDPWSLDDTNAFHPAKNLPFTVLPSADPERALNVHGLAITQVAWRTSGAFDASGDFDTVMADLVGLVRRCEGLLPAVARALCAGRDGYGGRDKEGKLTAQVAAFMGVWVRCKGGEALADAEGEGGMGWVEAAATMCQGRCLFTTASGHVGLGPGEMGMGDVVCVFGGAVMPVVLRRRGEEFGVVGDCYLDGVMDGKAVDAMERGKCLRGPVPVEEEDRRAQAQYEPVRLGAMSLC